MRAFLLAAFLCLTSVSTDAQILQAIVGQNATSASTLIAPNAVSSATLSFWYRGKAGCLNGSSSTCVNNDVATTLTDQSSGSHNLTLSGCANGPTYKTAITPNSQAALFLNGSTNCMTSTFASLAKTVITVFWALPNSQYSGLLCGKPQSGDNITAFDIYAQTPPVGNNPFQARQFDYGTSANSTGYSNYVNPARAFQVWSISSMTNDGTTLKVYEGPTLIGSQAVPGGATLRTPSGLVLGAGCYNNSIGGGGTFFQGYFAEAIGYNGVLSSSDMAGVVAWLQNEYGLTPSGNYIMMSNNQTTASYQDQAIYMFQGDGTTFASTPANYVPLPLAGQSNATALAPQMLHDDQGRLVKYNGKYWAEVSPCGYPGVSWPCHYVDILYSNDAQNWVFSGRLDCDVVLDGTSSTRGCFNDGWFIDRANSNAVYAFYNASNNEQNNAGNIAYAAAITLNANGTFTAGSVTAFSGSGLPFGSTGTSNTGFFIESVINLSGTYYAFVTNLNGLAPKWITSNSPFSGYNGSLGALSGITYNEWPVQVQTGGNGDFYGDQAGNKTNHGTFSDGALGTVGGVTSVPLTMPNAGATFYKPQSASVVKLPAVILP